MNESKMLERNLEQELQIAADRFRKQVAVNELIAAIPNLEDAELAQIHDFTTNPKINIMYRLQIVAALRDRNYYV